jgi:hypothetical protein
MSRKGRELFGAMTTCPRFMRPCSIGPNGSLVPYTMIPFVMIGPFFCLCFLEGTNKTCLIYPTKNRHIFINNFISPPPRVCYIM